MGAARAGLLVLPPLVFATLVARAAELTTVAAGVRVATPSCPIAPVPIADFVDALRVELAGQATPRARGSTLVTPVIAPCDPSTTRVEITVTDEAGGGSFARSISLEDVAPSARPRALALAVAELLRIAPEPAEAARQPPTVFDEPAARPETPPRRLVVDAAGVASLFPNRETTLWGGRLGLAVEGRRSHAGAFAEVAVGQRAYADGEVDIQSFGAGLFFGPRWEARRVALAPALLGGLAWARARGHPGAPGVVARSGGGLTAAVRLRLALAVRMTRITGWEGFCEGGVVARGLDATVDGARGAGVSGASVVLGVGLRIGP